jgi:hypothetical protein
MLYKISKANNKRGIGYWNFNDGLKFLKAAKKHFALLRRLDTII